MTYFAKDEMRITLGSLLNIFMSVAIKGRLFIAVWHKNLEEFCLRFTWIFKESWRKLKIAICQWNWLFQIALSWRNGFWRSSMPLWYYSVVLLLEASILMQMMFYMCFCYGLKRWWWSGLGATWGLTWKNSATYIRTLAVMMSCW